MARRRIGQEELALPDAVTEQTGMRLPASTMSSSPSAISGTFQLTSTSSNEVLSFSASKFNPNDYYTSVASLGGFGLINPHTGVFTLLVPAAGAHGLTFTPGPATGANYAGDAASAFSAPACVADLAQALHDGASWAGTFAPVVGQDAAPLGNLSRRPPITRHRRPSSSAEPWRGPNRHENGCSARKTSYRPGSGSIPRCTESSQAKGEPSVASAH